jgi:hypothetical protein
MKLQITQKLKDDIFGQFKGLYLSDEQHQIEISKNSSESKDIVNLNKGDSVVIDFLYHEHPKIGDIIELQDFLLKSYAKNPQKGIVIIITGKFIIFN